MKLLKKLAWVLLFALVVAQFFRPEKNEGDLTTVTAFISETKPPEEVQLILKNTCYDCHSNFTRYPWYNAITPINFWLADHVDHGKDELNFSDWSNYSLKRKEHKMEEVYEEVKEKHMPLDSYTWTHRDANLSDQEIELVVNWAKNAQAHYKVELNKE